MDMAKKKSFTLPFVVAPRREPITEVVGTEESGQIEIQRKGYLTVSEKSFIQQATTGDETVSMIQRLASKVSKEKGVSPQVVMNAFSAGELASDMFSGHEDEVSELIAAMSSFEERRKAIAVTCMIYFRISEEWSVEQTMELHPDLISAIYQLFTDEDTRSMEAFEALEEEGASPEGKSSTGNK